jgi:carbonic anhydrase
MALMAFYLMPSILLVAYGSVLEYDYLKGSSDWDALGVCGTGTEQSPINIPRKPVQVANPEQFEVTAQLLDIPTEELSAEFTDVTYMINRADGKSFGSITAYKVGESTPTVYTDCVQFHVHAPSEHTIDGDFFDFELHVVCLYPDVTAPGERNYAVLGFLFNEGRENEFIASLIDETRTVDWSLLEGYPTFSDYYHYDGGLTTPGCDEVVTWLLTSKVLEMSSDQLSFFTSQWAGNPTFGKKQGNNRLIQPLNGRTVYIVGEKYDDFYSKLSKTFGAVSLFFMGI